ncbi:unnamed protein product [Somion occarium]|uniref:Uncharacterized protein n=1 Tax=Somion occarium TaxID=3059160 RepID=A0ABP1E4L8_9APHY
MRPTTGTHINKEERRNSESTKSRLPPVSQSPAVSERKSAFNERSGLNMGSQFSLLTSDRVLKRQPERISSLCSSDELRGTDDAYKSLHSALGPLPGPHISTTPTSQLELDTSSCPIQLTCPIFSPSTSTNMTLKLTLSVTPFRFKRMPPSRSESIPTACVSDVFPATKILEFSSEQRNRFICPTPNMPIYHGHFPRHYIVTMHKTKTSIGIIVILNVICNFCSHCFCRFSTATGCAVLYTHALKLLQGTGFPYFYGQFECGEEEDAQKSVDLLR